MPPYPYLATDYSTQLSLFTHHMWIGGFLIVGVAAHAAIFMGQLTPNAQPAVANVEKFQDLIRLPYSPPTSAYTRKRPDNSPDEWNPQCGKMRILVTVNRALLFPKGLYNTSSSCFRVSSLPLSIPSAYLTSELQAFQIIYGTEEKLLLGIKIAVTIVGFMIFIVILIRKLRECNSSSGSSASEGGGVINSQVGIQLPTLNTDDGSVIASAA
uniref:Uncharacterized protein n=1 Tax=Quercus lobata TaxID=97700 RepID=A0A7N2MYX9_QUELO